VEASVAQLSGARVRLLVQGAGYVSAITDDLDRFSAPTQIHAVVEAGSAAAGLRGRLSLADGITLLGGFSGGREDYRNIVADTELNGTLAIRYAPPGFGASRPFVEVGGLIGHADDLTMRRTYANGVGTAVGEGSASYSNSAVWGRAGWIWDTGKAGEIGVYGEYGQVRQSIGAYIEPISNIDPFEAVVGRGQDRMNVGKLGLRWEHDFAHGWEAFVGLTFAHSFSQEQVLPVDVDGFGPVAAPSVGQQTWGEYRVRVGHSVSGNSSLSLFVSGIAGSSLVGDDTHVGIDYRATF
jgi:hypothetical protein